MSDSRTTFRINFLEGHDKDPIEDIKGEFKSFRDFVSAHAKNLSYADLRNQDLTGCDLSGANLARADLSFAKLGSAVLDGASIDHAKFNHATLTNVTASNVSAIGMRGEYADLSGSVLRAWKADGAALTGVTVDGTTISSSSFKEADLSELHGVNTKLIDSDFRGASFAQSFAVTPVMRGCSFSRNSARAAIEWNNARMPGASIDKCSGFLPVTITLESKISRLAATAASTALIGLGTTVCAAAAAMPSLNGLTSHLYGTSAVITASGVGSLAALRASDSIWNKAARKFGGILGKTARKVVAATRAAAERLGITPTSSEKALREFQRILDETYVCLGSKESENSLKSAFHALYIGRETLGRKIGIAEDMVSTFGPSSEILVCNRTDLQKLDYTFSRLAQGHEAGCTVVVDPHAVVQADGQTPAIIQTGKVLTDICFVEKQATGKIVCIVAEYKKDGCLFGMTRTVDGITKRYRPQDPETINLDLPSLEDAVFSMERAGHSGSIVEADPSPPARETGEMDCAIRNDYEASSGNAAPTPA
ncbi:pentapeptide repeat-containing protein [Acetobacter persici]|uniref:Pentapeptide repeat-containing protein n=1 Tax=Acetobacter persici TaxID=1076596 RepID=A0A1U9LIV1_9PROT|nr:pentapeptide repeat-containing protein [Acetobacter persici]AQT06384.1 hypothetical protein A0U91_15325 [Acetobacter persici]